MATECILDDENYEYGYPHSNALLQSRFTLFAASTFGVFKNMTC